jgi:hypothetical protein
MIKSNQSNPNNDISYETIEYKHRTCAGKNCKNIAKHHLMLVFIKRSGWFCENCRQSLQEDGLVESVFKESAIGRSENNFGKV